jgi:hypothetical protein
MKSKYRIFYTLVIGLLLGCSNSQQGKPSIAVMAKNIDDLINTAPKSVIDLDQMEGETIYPSLVIGGDTVEVEAGAKEVFLAQPVASIVMNDSIYICDFQQNVIIVADSNGRLIRKIGRAGQAPGEFIRPAYIAKNEKLVLVSDLGNARAQIFDHTFSYITSIPAASPPTPSIAISNVHLFMHSAALQDSHLVEVYEARLPFQRLYTFVPRIIPYGQQPSAMNILNLAINKTGDLCLGYMPLPYLFVFDAAGRQYATIEFNGKTVELLDKPLRVRTSGGIPVRPFISGLAVLDDQSIVLGNLSVLYLLKRQANGNFILRRKLNLHYSNHKMEPEDEDIPIYSIFVDKNKLYINPGVKTWVLCYDISS